MHTYLELKINLDAILYVCAHMHKVPEEARRGRQILELQMIVISYVGVGIEYSALNTESFLQPKYFFKMDPVSFQCGGLQTWLFVRNKKGGSQA